MRLPRFLKGMKAVVVKPSKEWIAYPEGAKPIRILIDKRLKFRTKKTPKGIELTSPGVYSYPEERQISMSTIHVHPTRIGHEFGHILMGHRGLIDKEEEITPKWLQEEVEAEFWAYKHGYPIRQRKLKYIATLAKEIGLDDNDIVKLMQNAEVAIKHKSTIKPKITKGEVEEPVAINPIKKSTMPKEVAMAIGSVSAKLGSDGRPRIKVRRL